MPPSYAYVKGAFDLVVFANGQAGRGFAHARVFFKLINGASSGGGPYQGEYRTAHEITSAFCSTDGSLEFASQAFAVEKMNASGQPPPGWRLRRSLGHRNGACVRVPSPEVWWGTSVQTTW